MCWSPAFAVVFFTVPDSAVVLFDFLRAEVLGFSFFFAMFFFAVT
jgi:hypothetical protein